ncbi:unknown [Firmicutes bacterium CAG:170]|nr:unknown [Firmicutes bacterium CAG:170]
MSCATPSAAIAGRWCGRSTDGGTDRISYRCQQRVLVVDGSAPDVRSGGRLRPADGAVGRGGRQKIAPQHHSGQERPGEEIRHPDRRAAGKGDGKMSESGRGRAGLRALRHSLEKPDRHAARIFTACGAVFHRRGVDRHDRYDGTLRPTGAGGGPAAGAHSQRAWLHGQHRHFLQQAAGENGGGF